MIQSHGTIQRKCLSARHGRLHKRNEALKVVSDAASAADFEQVRVQTCLERRCHLIQIISRSTPPLTDTLAQLNLSLSLSLNSTSHAHSPQALQTLALQSAQFPADTVLASCADLIREKSADHAHAIAEARKAISAHAFVVAVQQVRGDCCW